MHGNREQSSRQTPIHGGPMHGNREQSSRQTPIHGGPMHGNREQSRRVNPRQADAWQPRAELASDADPRRADARQPRAELASIHGRPMHGNREQSSRQTPTTARRSTEEKLVDKPSRRDSGGDPASDTRPKGDGWISRANATAAASDTPRGRWLRTCRAASGGQYRLSTTVRGQQLVDESSRRDGGGERHAGRAMAANTPSSERRPVPPSPVCSSSVPTRDSAC
jgi:hypothetical protein